MATYLQGAIEAAEAAGLTVREYTGSNNVVSAEDTRNTFAIAAASGPTTCYITPTASETLGGVFHVVNTGDAIFGMRIIPNTGETFMLANGTVIDSTSFLEPIDDAEWVSMVQTGAKQFQITGASGRWEVDDPTASYILPSGFAAQFATNRPVRLATGAAVTVQPNDATVIVNNATAITVTIPAAENYDGRTITIKNGTPIQVNVTVDTTTSIETGPSEYTMTAENASLTIQYGNGGWWIIAEKA